MWENSVGKNDLSIPTDWVDYPNKRASTAHIYQFMKSIWESPNVPTYHLDRIKVYFQASELYQASLILMSTLFVENCIALGPTKYNLL